MTNFDDIQRLAAVVDDQGLTAVPHDRLTRVAADALRRGASPVLAAVLADPSQPEVARTRAFGKITTVFISRPRPLVSAA